MRNDVPKECLELRIPPTQAIRYLKQKGIAYAPRPRVLTTVFQERIDELLLAGEGRDQIAATLGIRKAFVKDYLATRPDLRQAWEVARTERMRGHYRTHFLKVLEEHPGVPIKQIRRIDGNGFEWLYRNDGAWLASHLPGIWHRPD